MEPETKDSPLLTLEEAAAMWHCKPSTMEKRLTDGTVPQDCISRLKGLRRVIRKNFVKFIEAGGNRGRRH